MFITTPVTAEPPDVFTISDRSSDLNEDWQFRLEDETDWQEIDLPHDWSISQDYSTEYEAESGFLPVPDTIRRR